MPSSWTYTHLRWPRGYSHTTRRHRPAFSTERKADLFARWAVRCRRPCWLRLPLRAQARSSAVQGRRRYVLPDLQPRSRPALRLTQRGGYSADIEVDSFAKGRNISVQPRHAASPTSAALAPSGMRSRSRSHVCDEQLLCHGHLIDGKLQNLRRLAGVGMNSSNLQQETAGVCPHTGNSSSSVIAQGATPESRMPNGSRQHLMSSLVEF